MFETPHLLYGETFHHNQNKHALQFTPIEKLNFLCTIAFYGANAHSGVAYILMFNFLMERFIMRCYGMGKSLFILDIFVTLCVRKINIIFNIKRNRAAINKFKKISNYVCLANWLKYINYYSPVSKSFDVVLFVFLNDGKQLLARAISSLF